MYNVGDKIVCINDKSIGDVDIKEHLTLNKIYVIKSTPVLPCPECLVYFIGDDNEYHYYNSERFISLKEYRKKKLIFLLG